MSSTRDKITQQTVHGINPVVIVDADDPTRALKINSDGSISGGGAGGGGGVVTAAAGGFADGAITTLGLEADTAYTDATGAASGTGMNVFKGLFVKLAAIATSLAGILSIKQADLTASGTISAAQPVIGTPVTNATVVLSVGQGQSSWKAALSNGGGGFTAGTTIVVDQTVDGTNWITSSFKVAGSNVATTVLSVVGPGPLIISGDCGSANQIRVRCSVLNASETIAVTLRAGAGPGSVGIIGEVAVNLNQINGATLSISNPNIIESNIQNAIRNGQSFVAQARNTTASSIIVGLAVFNAAISGKNILITSIKISISASTNALGNSLYLQTSDPALGTGVTPVNLKPGGAASVASCSSSNTVLTPVGTLLEGMGTVATTTVEVLSPNQTILLPAGSANGVTMYVTAATVVWMVAITWVEY